MNIHLDHCASHDLRCNVQCNDVTIIIISIIIIISQTQHTALIAIEQSFTHRVPDLKLDLLPLDVDHPGPELDPDGEVVDRLEPLVRELQQEARLAHPWFEKLSQS